jgi:very-short-patch-repair endonuclease
MTKIFNKNEVKKKRQDLRKNMPPAEVLLWYELKGKKLLGYKFRRQYSIDKYITDFCCPRAKLIREIDGDSRFIDNKAKEYDRQREKHIKSIGFDLLRFNNLEIYCNLERVLDKIKRYLKPPLPLLGKEGKEINFSQLRRGREE